MLIAEEREKVLHLIINRPERRNAIGSDLVRSLDDNLERAVRSPAFGSILLSGTPPGFCAGSDLKELAGMSVAAMREHEAETARMTRNLISIEVPVVAAVSGFALGGGLFLAASCDLVVTSPRTRWGLPEVKLGWIPPWGFAALIARVGAAKARAMTLTASEFDGSEAYRIGLADRLVDDAAPGGAEIVKVAMELAVHLACLPAIALSSVKRFFEPIVGCEAEALDRLAGQLFEQNCSDRARSDNLKPVQVR